MKTILLFVFCLLGLNIHVLSQVNLISNPSFEDTINCPTSVTQIYNAVNWYSFRDSPDYFHTCDNIINGVVGVPSNCFSFQYPHSGLAFAGIIPYDLTGAPYREYLATELTGEALIIGKRYYLTFYVSWSGALGFEIAINKLGMVLTNNFYSLSNPYPITNSPMAYSNIIFTDSVNWSKIQLSFIADSSYRYLVLGNFFDDAHTDTLHLGQFNSHSYYFIDDVCLSDDSVYCSGFNSVDDLFEFDRKIIEKYTVHDNTLYIEFINSFGESEISLYSILGQMLSKTKTNQSEISILLPLSNEVYIVKVDSKNNSQILKIVN